MCQKRYDSTTGGGWSIASGKGSPSRWRARMTHSVGVAAAVVALVGTALPANAAGGDGSVSPAGPAQPSADTPFTPAYNALVRGGGVASQGAGLARRAGASSAETIALTGVPTGASVVRAFLIWTTIGSLDPTATLDGGSVTGALVGISHDTCWGLGPNRVYRANVTSLVPGNGNYLVSGVADTGTGDGQGASLVVVYGQSTASTVTRVVIRTGARSLTVTGASRSIPLLDQSTSTPQSASLHLGMGDGQVFGEEPIEVQGQPVTGANLLSGTDGPLWDDVTIPLPTDLVAADEVVNVTLTIRDDCLVWSYAALTERFPSP